MNMNSWMLNASLVFGFVHHVSVRSCLLRMLATVLNLAMGSVPLFGSHSSLEGVEAGPSRLFDEGRDSLVVSHLNIRSLSSKLDELRDLLGRESGLSMAFGVSETWLDGTIADAEVEIAGFRSYRRDRGVRGGGIMVYVSEVVKSMRRQDLEAEGMEIVWIYR